MDIKVSVIVTVHNSERYLRECLKSVCSQTLNELEIICVDGGSHDASPQILKEFAEEDTRVLIVNDINTSYGHKVNQGISLAKGEYIAILESDDRMQENMLEELYGIAKKYDLDYADCDYYQFYHIDSLEYKEIVRKYSDIESYGKVLCGNTGQEIALTPGLMAIWTGLYKKEFLVKKDIRLNESPGASFQDVSFRYMTAALAQSSYHISEPLHNYRIDNVYSSVKDSSKIFVVQKEYEYLKEELIRHNLKEEHIWELYYIWKHKGYLWNAWRLKGEAQSLFLDVFTEEIEKDSGKCTDRETLLKQIIEMQDSQKKALELKNNMLQKTAGKSVVIFGAGIRGKQVLTLMQHQEVCCFCDNDIKKKGMLYDGFPVMTCAEATERYREAYFIITNRKYIVDMKQQLLDLGIKESHILIY